jgi:hypothetical protein
MNEKRRTLGQFETPPVVADLLLGFCLRQPSDWLLDPSCGDGAFLQRADLRRRWLANSPREALPERLWGVELDGDTAVTAANCLPQAKIFNQNFFTLKPEHEFDALIGNPPYTRAEWIGRLNRQSGEQLAFDWQSEKGLKSDDQRLAEANHQSSIIQSSPKQRLIPRHLWQRLSHRSGLHAYFFLHGLEFLREGGRLGFVVPNGWLDVAYGAELKQFLLDNFRIIALIESGVERWFKQAKINTCLVVLEKCSQAERRAANLVRLVWLKRPLSNLIPYAANDPQRMLAVERLAPRLLPSDNRHSSDFDVRVLPQWKLKAASKWGVALRAPDVYRQQREQTTWPPLKSWAAIRRGFTTGANEFFYLNTAVIEKWGIEPKFRRPLLKSLRGLDRLQLNAADCQTELLWLPPGTDVRGTAASDYTAWGESQEFDQRRTCAARQPWYSLPEQSSAQLVLPKGVWLRHMAPLLADDLLTDQQLYRVNLAPGVSPLAAAALLNSAWFALQCELHGRINFGAGLLWLATYELESIMLPDPRQLTTGQIEQLETCFTQLAQRPIGYVAAELDQPDRRALDTAVFDILQFQEGERTAVYNALRDRIQTRQRRALVTQ